MVDKYFGDGLQVSLRLLQTPQQVVTDTLEMVDKYFGDGLQVSLRWLRTPQ